MGLKEYENFLEIFTGDIEAMFEHQKDYISCKEGCSHCCEYGEYPFTEIEFQYLIEGYNQLDSEVKETIKKNFKDIKLNEEGYYVCPFLIDKKCSVYNNRGLTCRTFGLLNQEEDKRVNGPFCGKMGLNYAEVYDKETKQLLFDVIRKKQYKHLPRVFNLNISNIRNLNMIKELGIEFSEQRPLKDWLKEIEL